MMFLILVLLGNNHKSKSDLELGKQIFYKRCKVCHGNHGNANAFVASILNPPPRNFTTKLSRKELTRKRMSYSITYGRPGTAMMPWKDNLTPREIRAVILYIRQTFMGFIDTKMDAKH